MNPFTWLRVKFQVWRISRMLRAWQKYALEHEDETPEEQLGREVE